MSPNHSAYLYPINQIMTVVQQICDAAYLVKLIANILSKIINTAQGRLSPLSGVRNPPFISPFPPSLSLLHSGHSPSLPLEVGHYIQLRGLGSAENSPSGVWGGAPAEIEFGAFQPLNMTSGGNKFNDFRENQMTKFHAGAC